MYLCRDYDYTSGLAVVVETEETYQDTQTVNQKTNQKNICDCYTSLELVTVFIGK